MMYVQQRAEPDRNWKTEVSKKLTQGQSYLDQYQILHLNWGNIPYIANTFTSYGYLWNYSAMSQTWEDPDHVDSPTKYQG